MPLLKESSKTQEYISMHQEKLFIWPCVKAFAHVELLMDVIRFTPDDLNMIKHISYTSCGWYLCCCCPPVTLYLRDKKRCFLIQFFVIFTLFLFLFNFLQKTFSKKSPNISCDTCMCVYICLCYFWTFMFCFQIIWEINHININLYIYMCIILQLVTFIWRSTWIC